MDALTHSIAASNCDGKPKPHLLAVPYPPHGHMLPLLDLAALLAGQGIALTVAVTPGNVRPLAALPSSVATVVLPFPSTPFLPAGCADQFTNAWLLMEAGVGVSVAEGADTVPDAGKMASIVATKVAESTRRCAVELGRKAAAAVAVGGTSYNDLEELVRALNDVR